MESSANRDAENILRALQKYAATILRDKHRARKLHGVEVAMLILDAIEYELAELQERDAG